MKLEYGDLAMLIEVISKEASSYNNPLATIDDLYEYLEDNANQLFVIDKGSE